MSVGQCNSDHLSIKTFLEKNFDCEVIRIDSTAEALEELKKSKYDLVLVNRKLDADYSDGTILIQAIKQDTKLRPIPIMLISNYPEYQEEAVKLGALYGFGKAELNKEETKQKVQQALSL